MTGARTAMLAGVMGLIVAEWSLFGRRKRLVIPVLVSGLAAAALFAASALPGLPLSGIFDGFSAFFLRSGEGFDPSFISRSEIYGAVANVWLQHPLFGAGPGTIAEAVRSVQVYNSTGHSFWLQQLAEVGAFGVICYLSLL
ncbi:MAG: O-antigen ligase family protein, partial [Candidatus Marsarchaeota archaeon]|nr:O-antigen ligase family protein [Candidatus Marsarchaeota archaeon]